MNNKSNLMSHYVYLAGERLVPPPVREKVWRWLRKSPAVGQVDFGSLRSLQPVSRSFGFERGNPIDRYYIEQFLEKNAGDIRGNVLEIGDNSYTLQFGGDRVTRSDVLHVHEGNPLATFIGDLADAPQVPSDRFDCIILTQTLHLIYEARNAVNTLHRILKPGGVLLVTVPGLTMIDRGDWRDTWYWSFTALSMQRMFSEFFDPSLTLIETYGNVLTSTAFLQGLCVDELSKKEFDFNDPAFQLIISLRTQKT